MYFTTNYPSKAAAKRALSEGAIITIYQPGPFGGGVVADGSHCVEGPHYPKPHTFYGSVTVKDGRVVAIK